MRDALAPIAARFAAVVIELDVDDDPALEAEFGARVPMLMLGDPDERFELCHFHLDRHRVESILAAAGQGPLAKKADFR
jgi:hypothetical protein